MQPTRRWDSNARAIGQFLPASGRQKPARSGLIEPYLNCGVVLLVNHGGHFRERRGTP